MSRRNSLAAVPVSPLGQMRVPLPLAAKASAAVGVAVAVAGTEQQEQQSTTAAAAASVFSIGLPPGLVSPPSEEQAFERLHTAVAQAAAADLQPPAKPQHPWNVNVSTAVSSPYAKTTTGSSPFAKMTPSHTEHYQNYHQPRYSGSTRSTIESISHFAPVTPGGSAAAVSPWRRESIDSFLLNMPAPTARDSSEIDSVDILFEHESIPDSVMRSGDSYVNLHFTGSLMSNYF